MAHSATAAFFDLDRTVIRGSVKVVEIRRLAAERGYDLSRSTAYSDSISDLPFLEAVGNPVAINADSELAAHAIAHRWSSIPVAKPSLLRRPRWVTA